MKPNLSRHTLENAQRSYLAAKAYIQRLSPKWCYILLVLSAIVLLYTPHKPLESSFSHDRKAADHATALESSFSHDDRRPSTEAANHTLYLQAKRYYGF